MTDFVRQIVNGKNYARFLLSAAWSGYAMWFIYYIITHEVIASSVRFVDTILGFLLGTIVASIMNFWLGSSKSSSDKNEMIKNG